MSAAKVTKLPTTINPERVRYIKLGRKGGWEGECIKKGIIRYGFDTARPNRFQLCRDGRWSDLAKSFLDEGKDKGTATRFTNEARLFFEDKGSILWITFVGESFYWGLLDPASAQAHTDGEGVWRALRGGWCGTDLWIQPMTKDCLSGTLTMLTSHRGTSC